MCDNINAIKTIGVIIEVRESDTRWPKVHILCLATNGTCDVSSVTDLVYEWTSDGVVT